MSSHQVRIMVALVIGVLSVANAVIGFNNPDPLYACLAPLFVWGNLWAWSRCK